MSQFARSAAFLSLVLLSAVAFCSDGDNSSKQLREVLTIKSGSGFVTFSPDGKTLVGKVSGKSWRATDIRLWEVATGKELLTLRGHTGGIWKIAFSPNGKRLASNDNYTVKIWDLDTRKEFRSLKMPAFTRSVLFTSDATQVITGHDDGRIRFWHVGSSKWVRGLRGHTEWVPSLALSPDGKRLASASLDLTAKLWDLKTGKVIHSLRGHEWYLSSVAIGPKGRRLITGSDDMTARIWDLDEGRELFTLRGHNEWLRDVAFSPGGKLVATAGDDKTARIWDATTGKSLFTIKAHSDLVFCVTFSPNGQILATASSDGTIRLWDVRSLVQ